MKGLKISPHLEFVYFLVCSLKTIRDIGYVQIVFCVEMRMFFLFRIRRNLEY